MNSENNNEKINSQIAGRVTQSKKDWLDEYKKINNIKTFDELIGNVIAIVSSSKIDTTKDRLDFTQDLNSIQKSIFSITTVIENIKVKATQEIEAAINEANSRLEQKDAVLLEAESAMKEVIENGEAKFNEFTYEVTRLNNELSIVNKELETAEKNILALDKDNKDKDIVINQINIEKTKLNAEVTEHIEAAKEMQIKINTLLSLEQENGNLKNEVIVLNENIRNAKSELAILNNIVESKNNEIQELNNNVSSLKLNISDKDNNISKLLEEKSNLNSAILSKDIEINNLLSIKKELSDKILANEVALNDRNNEISHIKEEYRDAIANMTISHKEELLNIKAKIKEDIELKYESKIEKLKDEIYVLKKENERLVIENDK